MYQEQCHAQFSSHSGTSHLMLKVCLDQPKCSVDPKTMRLLRIAFLVQCVAFATQSQSGAVTYQVAIPELPIQTVDTIMPTITGAVRTVNCSGGVGDAMDLQSKLNAAVGGDAVLLPHGCVWTGNFIFPVHSGSGYVVVMTDALPSLPPPGTRVTPSNAPSMARLQLPAGSNQVAVLSNDYQNPAYSARASQYWRFVGLEIAAPSTVPVTYSLVTLDAIDDSNNGSAAGLPHHIVFDRVWVHADTLSTVMSRAFRANAAYFALVDSYISQIQAPSAPYPYAGEAQAICAWNSPGPFTIVNNYLEASTENVLFGGDFGSTSALWVASDITFQHNYVAKNAAWAPGGPTVWNTKNLFELKEGIRVLVTDNVFEYSWQGGQNGLAMTITPRTQQSGWWTSISDVTVSSNVIRHVGGFVSSLLQDDGCTSLNQSSRVNIAGKAVTWLSGPNFSTQPTYTGASFSVNGSGSYLFTQTSSTTGMIDTDLGTVYNATFTLQCSQQRRSRFSNILVDDINESYGTPAGSLKFSGFNDVSVVNVSTIRSDSSGRPALFFSNPGCYSGAQDLGNNLQIQDSLLWNTVNADCLIDPNSVFPLATGTVAVTNQVLINLGIPDQTMWSKWDAATQFSANVDTLGLTPDHTMFSVGSSFFGSGLGPDLTCFNESAIVAGTPSALCPLTGTELAVSGPASLPAGTVGMAYPSTTVTATGGTGTYTWSAAGLPLGLTLNATTGVLSGTPASATGGPFIVTVTATDSASATSVKTYSLSINPAVAVSGPASLPAGTVGMAYPSTTVTATGGTGTYTWSAAGLPLGLTLSATTGVLSGTPASATGSPFNVTVTATDSASATSLKTYSLSINAQPTVAGGVVLVAHIGGSGINGVTTSGVNTSGASLIIAQVGAYDGMLPTLTDSNGNTWALLNGGDTNGNNGYGRTYYCLNPKVGSGHTFTLTGRGSYSAIAVAAFSGISILDTPAFASTPYASTTLQSGSITPSQGGELIVAGLTSGFAYTSLKIDSGFTISDDVTYGIGNNYSATLAYIIQSVPNAISPKWTWNTPMYGAASVASFKAAVSSTTVLAVSGPASLPAGTVGMAYPSTVSVRATAF